MKRTCVLLLLVLSGCAVRSAHEIAYVSTSLKERTGHELRQAAAEGEVEIPPGVVLEDGLTAEEAVAVALWANRQFLADIASLGFAKADLIDAGLLRNPILSFLFPLGPKQLEATLNLPLDFFLQRPRRVAAARLDVERVAESLVQHGLDLARDVLSAHADIILAQKRRTILAEKARLLGETASIATARMKAGDISELEEKAFRLEAARAGEESVRAARDADIAEQELLSLLGLGLGDTSVEPVAGSPATDSHLDPSLLLESAFAARPDLRAAEIAIEAAGERLGLERSRILNLTATLDANGEGKEGFEMGPGFVLELPVFNWNNGKIARAKAEMERAANQYLAVRQRIAREVNEAHATCAAARKSLQLANTDALPAAEAAAEKAERAYDVGEISYLDLLVFERGLLETRLRAAEAEAELRKAEAALQNSVGARAAVVRAETMNAGEK